MSTKIINLQDVKDNKKYKKIVKDIEAILKIINLAQKGLSHYKEYVTAIELISIMETNKTMLEIHKKKYETKLKLHENEK